MRPSVEVPKRVRVTLRSKDKGFEIETDAVLTVESGPSVIRVRLRFDEGFFTFTTLYPYAEFKFGFCPPHIRLDYAVSLISQICCHSNRRSNEILVDMRHTGRLLDPMYVEQVFFAYTMEYLIGFDLCWKYGV